VWHRTVRAPGILAARVRPERRDDQRLKRKANQHGRAVKGTVHTVRSALSNDLAKKAHET
jgi:hypothetical protein